MKYLFTAADDYIRQADWRDLALIKFCLCSVGILIGLSIPKRSRKLVGVVAMLAFVGSYVPLMIKFFGVFKGCAVEQDIEIE